MSKIKYSILLIVSMTLGCMVNAQKKEQAKLFTEFMLACNSYKQAPLFLNIRYQLTANMPLPKEMVTTAEGEMYVTGQSAYLKFGNIEQLLTDSLILVVMNDSKHMVAQKNDQPVAQLLKAMLAKPLNNQSIEQLLDKYSIVKTVIDKATVQYNIESKAKLDANKAPASNIILLYNPVLAVPVKVTSTQRSLVNMPGGNEGDKIKTVARPDGSIAGIRELTTVFEYSKITHAPNLQLPISIADRIIKDRENNWVPVKAFEDYMLTEN